MHLEKEEITNLVKCASKKEVFDSLYSDRFISLIKEVGEEVHMDICFECKVI